jgi:hypothetical protein
VPERPAAVLIEPDAERAKEGAADGFERPTALMRAAG